MSDSMGKAVWEAASGGKEAELARLIGLGGSVNWHNPAVRRRMCLAWAPASSPPLVLSRSPSPPTRRSPDSSPSPHSQRAARRARGLAVPPPRRPAELGTRLLDVRRAPPARTMFVSSHFGDRVIAGLRAHSPYYLLIVRARRVRPTPPRLQGGRERHGCKSRACPPRARAMGSRTSHERWTRCAPPGPRSGSITSIGILWPPRSHQAPPRGGRGPDASRQVRRHGPRRRTVEWLQRGRGAPQRASVRGARAL